MQHLTFLATARSATGHSETISWADAACRRGPLLDSQCSGQDDIRCSVHSKCTCRHMYPQTCGDSGSIDDLGTQTSAPKYHVEPLLENCASTTCQALCSIMDRMTSWKHAPDLQDCLQCNMLEGCMISLRPYHKQTFRLDTGHVVRVQ